ncbi:cytidylyltransferase domain-containing protein [Leptospira noguchii]|uniref:Acylneuraminate cytidylyltransferase family protein n=1 Tax=Leptospira noguchii TaxID=28182 RepID=A0AAE9G7X8_9LEPT|nr:acylneuraminate cytidylyltransferase family protein [Leptospira noguchii]UOG29269.1 acylneuraminate cytidylyltransferase family protein [Leptospira noguchii]UOG35385.1 acylneuraminate cytidylyltransferase family protein [Leptospira noguchii]UOG46303.1 acylneuraminate cytidylyltransferase family protein [Leptospira noguchii]UOG55414.1 acylneuraminate cytidylyltransferase family protein [Leptospira noguchii]
MRILGIIVARSGSKGIPKKNLKCIADKPLIQYTIECAHKSKKLSEFIVSTDGEDIRKISLDLGVKVPFLRPKEISDDVASPILAIQHAKSYYENLNIHFDGFLMLQPTTPFRSEEDIDGSIELLEVSNADSVISVVNVGAFHPARMKYMEAGKLIDPPFCEEYENQRRQELKPMFIRNGAIYLSTKKTIENSSFRGKDCRAWLMPNDRSVNIDTEEDFLYAEWMFARMNSTIKK